MSHETWRINKSKEGPYYVLTRNKEFIGNYDSVYEASLEMEHLRAAEIQTVVYDPESAKAAGLFSGGAVSA